MRRIITVAGAWLVAAAAAQDETPRWVKVTPEVMAAGSVVPRITFDCVAPGAMPAGASMDILLPWHFGVPQTEDAAGDNYFYAEFPADVTSKLEVVRDVPRSYVLRVTLTSGVLMPGTKFKLFVDRERVHPFDHAEVAFATIIRAPAPEGEAEGPIVARGQATVVKIPGGPPAKFRVVAPTCVTPGEPFAVRVAALDANNNRPGSPWKGALIFTLEGVAGPKKFAMKGNYAEVAGFSAPDPGVFRLAVAGDTLSGRSNPIVCREEWDRRIFWGDIHGHSAFSDGMRQPDEFFDYGRYVALLDATCLTDHAECLYGDEWPIFTRIANEKNAPPAFVTFVSYEWTSDAWGGGYGHRCVYFQGEKGEYYNAMAPESDTPGELWSKYRETEVVTIPHHSLAGFRWSNFNAAFDRNVEIVSHWGCSEYEGNPFWNGRQWKGGGIVDALDSYYLLGFVGGSDNHNGAPGQNHAPSRFPQLDYWGGATAFLAQENTRPALYDALYNRRVYATAGNRDFIDFTVDGAPMASVVAAAGAPTVFAEVATEDKLKSVEVVRGGKTAYEAPIAPGADYAQFHWKDDGYDGGPTYYYLRVTTEDGHLAFATPIWVAAGTRAENDATQETAVAAGQPLALPAPAPRDDHDYAVCFNVRGAAGGGEWAVTWGGEVLAAAAVAAGRTTIPFQAPPGAWDATLTYHGDGSPAVADVATLAYPWLEPRWKGRWWAFESEDKEGKTSCGAAVDDAAASATRALKVSPADNVYNKGVLWGPYQTLEKGRYRAYFFLRADGAASNKPAAEIEVVAARPKTEGEPQPTTLAAKVLSATSIAGEKYADFGLDFSLAEEMVMQYKVEYIGNVILYIDKVDVQQLAYE